MFPSQVYSFVCEPRVLKFGTQLTWVKSTVESNIELDMINCDVSMTSSLNFATHKPKIRPFSVLDLILVSFFYFWLIFIKALSETVVVMTTMESLSFQF